jgi:hypothetical protein
MDGLECMRCDARTPLEEGRVPRDWAAFIELRKTRPPDVFGFVCPECQPEAALAIVRPFPPLRGA